jgi:membrane protein
MNEWFRHHQTNLANLGRGIETRISANEFLRTLLQAVRAYSEDHCSMIAAALSYYALISIFPLMLLLVSETSNFIPPDRLIRSITSFFSTELPISATVLQSTLREVIQLRGAITTASAIGFVWSAAGVFDMIQLGINRAFRVPRGRPRWRQRLISLGMVTAISLLFGASLMISAIVRLGVQAHLFARRDPMLEVASTLGAFMISIAIFGLLYRFIPFNAQVRWRQVFLGAVIAAILWEIAKGIFVWYVTDYALLNLVYGSIGAVIAIMLWCFITSTILLIGAEIAAVVAGAREHEKTGNEWWALQAP